MVARSEAHDSGLCAADPGTRRRFATDLLNLTLAGPRVNRYEEVDRDAAVWLPRQNRCWFKARVINVRQHYGLTIDRREAATLDQVLAGCASTELITFARGEVPSPPVVRAPEAIAAWDDNRNGRVSCAEARAHGIAPVTRDHPAYPFMRDGDGDGVVCESGSRRTAPTGSRDVAACVGSRVRAHRTLQALRTAGVQVRARYRPWPEGLPVGQHAQGAAGHGLHTAGASQPGRAVRRQLPPDAPTARRGRRDQPRSAATPGANRLSADGGRRARRCRDRRSVGREHAAVLDRFRAGGRCDERARAFVLHPSRRDRGWC